MSGPAIKYVLVFVVLFATLSECKLLFAQSDEHSHSIPDNPDLQVLFESGKRAAESGNIEEAKPIFEKLLQDSMRVGSNKYAYLSLLNLGILHLKSALYSEANVHFTKALEMAGDNEKKLCEGLIYYADGMSKQQAGEHDSAILALDNARKISEELGIVEGKIFTSMAMANSSFAKGDFSSTLSHYLSILRNIRGSEAWKITEAETLFKMGKLQRLLCRYEEAIENFRKAVSSFGQTG